MLEGIRNTTKTSSESRKVANHIRLRRMTYGPRPCIRVYNEADATAAHVLKEISHNKESEGLYLDHLEFKKCVLFATTGKLIAVDFSGDMQWNVKWAEVIEIEGGDKMKLHIKMKKVIKKKKTVVVEKYIRCENAVKCKATKERLLSAREMAMLYVSLK